MVKSVPADVLRGIPWADVQKAMGLGRDSCYRLKRALAIEGFTLRPPDGGRVAMVTMAEARQLETAAAEVAAGKRSIASIETGLANLQSTQTEPELQYPDSAEKSDAMPLLDRLQALELASCIGAPLTTAEIRALLLVTPGSSTIVRGRLQARKLGRNCWIIEPVLA